MKKKILSLILAVLALCTFFASCGTNGTENGNDINIVCTVFPQYDWVKNIIGDTEGIKLTLLLDSGTDLHSYQPTASDIITISEADIFIYTGGTSDEWVEDVLKTSGNGNTLAINLMGYVGEENLYCVEAIGEEEHDHEKEHNHTHDEHIWLSVKNAKLLTGKIKDALCEKDEKNKDIYEANCSQYINKLSELDKKYADTAANASRKTVIFADRFPFIYLVKDYNLDYYAAFSGCSAESEASFETVTSLAEKTDELGLSYILITETSDASVAKTVVNSTKEKNQEILTLNSMQSVTGDKLTQSYIEIMESNLTILQKALS